MKTALDQRIRAAVGQLVETSLRSGHLKNQTESATLQQQLLDDFENGKIEQALERLIRATPNRPARRSVEQLIDSTLVALDLDPEKAKQNWKKAFLQLSGQQKPTIDANPRHSPVRDAFRGLTTTLSGASFARLRRMNHQRERLELSLKHALAQPERVKALKDLEAHLDRSATPDHILMGVLKGYREVEAWSEVLRFFDECPEGFQKFSAPRQERALALAMTNQTSIARNEIAQLILDGERTPALTGLLGRVLKQRYDELKDSEPQRAAAHLRAAAETYRNGFSADVSELYPGVALPVLLEARGDQASIAEAMRTAEVILTNAERRASVGERHFWDTSAALEMCCSLRRFDEAKVWLGRLIDCGAEAWMRRTVLLNLGRLLELRKGRGEDVAPLQAVVDQLTSAPLKARTAANAAAAADLKVVLEETYRFGGRSPKWLAGNYQYSGIAHDIRITPADVTYFDRVLKEAGIHKVSDPLAASKKMDQLIREHFGTAQMEDPKSPEHVQYDRVMKRLKELMGASAENSQTNVSADWINRLADCRQHAPAKLMLWEAWKRDQVQRLLSAIQTALENGATQVVPGLKAKLRELNAYELRIMDAQIVDAKDQSLVEEHTLTLLAKRKVVGYGEEMNELEALHLADSFYHSAHQLAEGQVTAAIKDGHLWIEVPNPSSDGRKIALRPAPYSRDRADSSVDYGQLKFRGSTVATPGWEKAIPVGGVDLTHLHALADAPAVDLPRPKAEAPKKKAPRRQLV